MVLVHISRTWEQNGEVRSYEIFLIERGRSSLNIRTHSQLNSNKKFKVPSAGLRRYTEGCGGGGGFYSFSGISRRLVLANSNGFSTIC